MFWNWNDWSKDLHFFKKDKHKIITLFSLPTMNV